MRNIELSLPLLICALWTSGFPKVNCTCQKCHFAPCPQLRGDHRGAGVHPPPRWVQRRRSALHLGNSAPLWGDPIRAVVGVSAPWEPCPWLYWCPKSLPEHCPSANIITASHICSIASIHPFIHPSSHRCPTANRQMQNPTSKGTRNSALTPKSIFLMQP